MVLPEPVSVRIWRYGIFEEDVSYYLLSLLRKGDVFVDVGGHFGYFTVLAGELVGSDGTVVSFEPMPATQAILTSNVTADVFDARHHLVTAAAGQIEGKVVFKNFGLTGSAFSSSEAARSDKHGLEGEVEVEVTSIDLVVERLKLDRVRLIKIDAENAEYQVVQGALETIRRFQPALIIETGDDPEDFSSNTRRVVDLVLAQGYQAIEFADWRLRPHIVRDHYGYGNLLLIPLSMAHLIDEGTVC